MKNKEKSQCFRYSDTDALFFKFFYVCPFLLSDLIVSSDSVRRHCLKIFDRFRFGHLNRSEELVTFYWNRTTVPYHSEVRTEIITTNVLYHRIKHLHVCPVPLP